MEWLQSYFNKKQSFNFKIITHTALHRNLSLLINSFSSQQQSFPEIPTTRFIKITQSQRINCIEPNSYPTNIIKSPNISNPTNQQQTISMNSFSDATFINGSVDLQLTQTIRQVAQFEESSLLLSLSNYLQHNDSSVCFQDKCMNVKFKADSKQSIFKRCLIMQQCSQRHSVINQKMNYEEQSQSMLLVQSQVKQTRPQQNYQQFLNHQQQADFSTSFHNSNQQLLPSRIQHSNFQGTTSIQLMELLSIPKDSQKPKLQSIGLIKKQDYLEPISISKTISEDQHDKINQFQNSKSNIYCSQCQGLQQRVKNLQQYLNIKEKEILQYQALIEKLYATIFDLKIENKKLNFQNQQYINQLQQFITQNNDTKTKPKIQPQAQAPVLSLCKHRKSNSYSNPHLEASISNLKQQPLLHKIKKKIKVDNTPKENNKNLNTNEKDIQNSNGKSEKNVMRFSNLSKDTNHYLDDQSKPNQQAQLTNHLLQKSRNKSPIQKHDFLKVKTKQFITVQHNLTYNLRNKISEPQGSISQRSQIKTQKLSYGLKKQHSAFQQNDYNITNVKNSHSKGLRHCDKIQNQFTQSRVTTIADKQICDKSSVVYKSFKEIGQLSNNETVLNKNKGNKEHDRTNRSPYEYSTDYGILSDVKKNRQNVYGEKTARSSFSPSPQSFARRQQNEKLKQTTSSSRKQGIDQSERKSFLR